MSTRRALVTGAGGQLAIELERGLVIGDRLGLLTLTQVGVGPTA